MWLRCHKASTEGGYSTPEDVSGPDLHFGVLNGGPDPNLIKKIEITYGDGYSVVYTWRDDEQEGEEQTP